jgi:hypothetical protein
MRCIAFVLAVTFALPVAAADDRMRTVVIGLTARRGVDDKQLAALLSDVVQGVYTKDPKRIVIGRDDLQRVLDLEAEKAQLGCDNDKCLAEVGAALDAQRLVTGSIDKIGDGYMVTLSEIDAKTLEAVGREQERVKNDENALVDAVTRLAQTLVNKGGVGVASSVVGNAGSLEILTDPRGAQILLAGNNMGTTPTKIDNLSTGNQKLRLLRDDYEPVEVEVPIYAGGVTKVNAEMRILRALAEKNLEARRASWRERDQWNTIGGWTKAGIGGVVAAGGTLLAISGGVDRIVTGQGGNGVAFTGLAVGGLGAAVLAWGVVDLLNPPAPPVPEWEIERKVVVTPPSGQGEKKVHVLQHAVSAPTTQAER